MAGPTGVGRRNVGRVTPSFRGPEQSTHATPFAVAHDNLGPAAVAPNGHLIATALKVACLLG